MIHFLQADSDYITIAEYLGYRGRELASRFTLHRYEDLPRWNAASAGTYVFADLDQLYPSGQRFATALFDELARQRAGFRTLNSPGRTLLRLELIDELHRRGMNAFRAVRATEDYRVLRYPVFVREEHGHSGALTPLLDTPREVEAGIGSAIARGRRITELLVVEFCDTICSDGFYRKYGAYIVGSEIIAQGLACGHDWMQKWSTTKFTEAMMKEHLAYVLENPHVRALSRIFEIAGVEYGRIDYSIKDGAIQTWEINLNPTVDMGTHSGPFPEALEPFREEAKRHFYGRLAAAWRAVDAGGEGLEPIPIRYSFELASAGGKLTRTRKERPWKRAVRRRLRPLKPAAVRIGSALSPLLVRLGRRNHP